MKVLFLDIDGVLNSENWFGYVQYCINNDMYNRVLNFVDIDNEHKYKYIDDERTEYKLNMIDDRAIANLNRIVEETGCKVVLSSSWRSSRESDNAFTEYILKLKGFKYELYGVTPRIWVKEFGTQRGEEIQLWMNKESEKNEIESYVILDDDSDMLPEQMSNFILVDRQVGLIDKDVFTAIEILNS